MLQTGFTVKPVQLTGEKPLRLRSPQLLNDEEDFRSALPVLLGKGQQRPWSSDLILKSPLDGLSERNVEEHA